MSILVVGTVAFDDIETPFGAVERVLGGSATHFSSAASLYAPVNLVSVVGKDFDLASLDYLRGRGVDLRGLEVVDGETFHWSGRYDYDLNVTETRFTKLNVYASFEPKLADGYAESDFVFLANMDPMLQLRVLASVKAPRLSMLDTMNYWIDGMRDELLETIRAVDMVTMNETELRMLSGVSSLHAGARYVLSLGPRALLLKKGEDGAVLFTKNEYFVAPAYPLEDVYDPTGAGDSFAGGFMGYLARTGDFTNDDIRRAVIHGSAVASFQVADFSVGRMRTLTLPEVERRYSEFREFTRFEPRQ
ncbi:MAG: sugar kinase [Dehalococcoidia bacterium]|nr:sugar kinase [Dehalococcoidia bacterium]